MNDSMVQRAIYILGMHRSGTSAVTRVLNLMGMDLGDHLLPPASDNPEGFWENLDFVNINEELFSLLGSSWDDVSAIIHNLPTASDPKLSLLKEKMLNAVKDNFSHSSLWGWKDPRTCISFPIWSDALDSIGIKADVVLTWRNPISVAKSLAKRNGFTLEKGYLLWYAYTLSALFHSSGHRRVLVNYDQLIDDWEKETAKIAHALQLPWPNNEKGFKSAVETFIHPDLRHTHIPMKQTIEELPAYAAELFDLLIKAEDIDGIAFKKKVSSLYRVYTSLEQSYVSLGKSINRPTGGTNMTLYYASEGSYSEERSMSEPLTPGVEHTFRFDLTLPSPCQLRLDPLQCPGIIDVIDIRIWSDSGDILFSADLNSLADKLPSKESSLVGCLIIGGQSPLLVTKSDDPQILLPEMVYSGSCHVTVSIRVADIVPSGSVKLFNAMIRSCENSLNELNQTLSSRQIRVDELSTLSWNQATKVSLLEDEISEYKQLVVRLNEVVKAQDDALNNIKKDIT